MREDFPVGTPSPVLWRAVENLVEKLSVHEWQEGVPTLIESLHGIAHAVESGSEIEGVAGRSLFELVFLGRLIERLRAELIESWSLDGEPPAAEEMLALLRSIEHVRTRLQARSANLDPDAALLFAHRGPELLVDFVHDLRSPLTSILFLAETLRDGQNGAVNDAQMKQLGIIYSAALNLISMASDMIEFARGGAKLAERRPAAFSLKEVVGHVCDLVAPVVEEKGLALRLQMPAHDQYLGYPISLTRILLNLTTNALGCTEEGGIEIAVREVAPSRIEFSVRDTGVGLDSEAQKHLFEPFWSGRSGRQLDFAGTGLGLAICRRLVTAMEGELRFETAPGRGTRFYFDLPLSPVGSHPA